MNKTIKVMTYNICHCMDYSNGFSSDFWNINLDKTANAIKEINADIVGLNEVYNSGEEQLDKQTEKISKIACYPYSYFAEAIVFEQKRSYGNAFLSKFPILDSQKFKVLAPTPSERRPNENYWYEDRVVLKSVIDVGVPLTVLITHFGLNLQEQERMINTLLNVIDSEKNPIILMGDFNVEPNNEILKPIYERLKSVHKEVGNTQKTFSTYENKIQIDYIFLSKDIKIKNFKRIETNVSDHYPCLCEIEI